MERKTIDFTIQEAGCLLYAADANLGGTSFGELHAMDWQDLMIKGALLSGSLYQDDGYNVRVLLGDLTDEEQSEWTGVIRWKLNLESGRLVVSGVCDEDLEEYMEDYPTAEQNGNYHLGCYVTIPPGEYAVTVYSYPPNDLSGGWMAIENPRSFRSCFGEETKFKHEEALDYWTRTRGGDEQPPDWIKNGWEDNQFLDFVIQLKPLAGEIRQPEFEDGMCFLWEYRKPDVCPKGIRF